MGSYKWGSKPPNMDNNSSYPTYNPTYNPYLSSYYSYPTYNPMLLITTHEPPSTAPRKGGARSARGSPRAGDKSASAETLGGSHWTRPGLPEGFRV